MEKDYTLEDLIAYMEYTPDEIDEVYKSKLESTLLKGKGVLNGLTGTKIDFGENYLARELLENYCRYSLNNANEYFEDNFKAPILRLQLQEGVKAHAE